MYSLLCCCVCMYLFFFSSRRRHTRCALVTGVQTCALPICEEDQDEGDDHCLVDGVADALRSALGVEALVASDHRGDEPEDPGLGQRGVDVGQLHERREALEVRAGRDLLDHHVRSEEHTSAPQSLQRITSAVLHFQKKKRHTCAMHIIRLNYTALVQ